MKMMFKFLFTVIIYEQQLVKRDNYKQQNVQHESYE